MLYSKRIERQAKKEKLTVDEKAMADLMQLGYSDADAYLITHQEKKLYPDEHVRKQIQVIVTSIEYIRYIEKQSRIEKRSSVSVAGDIESDDDFVLPSKEELAKEMYRVARKLPANSKERADVMMKFADLQQMKKESVEEEDVIHYYLPLTCNKCELYEKAKGIRQKSNKHPH